MPYTLLASRPAQKELDRLPPRIAEGVRLALAALAEDPHGARMDLKPLKPRRGDPPYLRLRIGTYRVVLQVDHGRKEVRVLRLGDRKDVYRGVSELDE